MPSGYTYRPSEGVTCYLLGQDLLVHSSRDDELFVLDDDARLLFEMIQRHADYDEITRAVCAEGLRLGPSVTSEIDRALEEMTAQGLVVAERSVPS